MVRHFGIPGIGSSTKTQEIQSIRREKSLHIVP